MDEQEEVKPGAPAWLATFADLMSLLMCFFVLLLSFAEMDAAKFKQVAESLEKAFGVQREVMVIDKPMGTSPDLTHFSPGKPEPTSQETVKQDTVQNSAELDTKKRELEILESMKGASNKQVERTLEMLEAALEKEIAAGQINVERDGERLIVRIEERGSFPSGSADFAPEFSAVLGRITKTVSKVPGDISVEGHTDDIPMRSARFRSNWELSASRAAAVATALLAMGGEGGLNASRVRVQGFAETKPRVPNDSNENRAQNRRVEVVVDLAKPVKTLEQQVRDFIEAGREDLVPDVGWE